jgi:hypothetical protein
LSWGDIEGAIKDAGAGEAGAVKESCTFSLKNCASFGNLNAGGPGDAALMGSI